MATDSTDPQEEALFREVDEDLHHARLAALANKYGGFVILAAIALVLAVGGHEGWNAWDSKQRAMDSLRYATAIAQIEDGKAAAASDALMLASTSGGAGYRAIAALRRADLMFSTGDGAGAIAIYRKIANDSGADAVHRDAARILAALHSVDQGDPKELEASIEMLTVRGNPWRYSALEIKALLALRQGEQKRADELLAEIADAPDAPSAMRVRAAEIMNGRSRATPGD